jgi:hypothetical protein
MFVPTLIGAALFYAFVPGVLLTFPKGASQKTVLVVHSLLFAVVTGLVMHLYRMHFESFGNHGASCPASHRMLPDQTCEAIGGERGKVYGPSPQVK